MDERGPGNGREPQETAEVEGPWPHCSRHRSRWAAFKGTDDRGETVYLCRWCGKKPPLTVGGIAQLRGQSGAI